MNASTRRNFLKSAPAAIVSSAVLSAPASASVASVAPMTASPELAEAHGRLLAALAEQQQAKDALEWLADEWRHRWPLAPEELLSLANADRYGSRDIAERNIIGSFIFRDTSELTTRFSAKMRQESPRVCFGVLTAERAQEILDMWTAREPAGRTEKALARNRASREEGIAEYTHKLSLARQYEAETARLKQAAKVTEAFKRITDAEFAVMSACSEVSQIPARNYADLAIKGQALKANGLLDAAMSLNGFFGELATFIQSTIDMAKAS